MAKRLSSIFSLGSTSSALSNESTSEASASARSTSNSTTPDMIPRKSLPGLQPQSNHQRPSNSASSPVGPLFDPVLPPQAENFNTMLGPPQLLPSAFPPRTESPGGSRPPSSASRPENSGEPFLQPPPLLKPTPVRPDSSEGSRPVSGEARPESRPASRPPSQATSRPASPTKFRPLTPTTEPQKITKKKSWLPGKNRLGKGENSEEFAVPQAWIVTSQETLPYDISALANFQRVPELWNEAGDTLVYLHARESGRGPSFKVDSGCFANSKKLVQAAHGGMTSLGQTTPTERQIQSFTNRVQNIDIHANSPTSPNLLPQGSNSNRPRPIDYFDDFYLGKDIQLCLPLPLHADLSNPAAKPTTEDVEILLTVRNLFAFLMGFPLVGTAKQNSIFTIFLRIADLMHRYHFSNLDSSTLGEEAASRFVQYAEDFRLGDVRASREKTIEAIVLGERMKSWRLYSEGFVHAVGKYDEISSLKSPKYSLISDLTRKRLERAHLDLESRLLSIRTRLNDFDFPSIFAGIANSTTSSESKVVRFKDWKSSYVSMRRHIMSFYKHRYGAWPPKAKSKKNDFEESGLNRLLLHEVYRDFADLYDILVDRTSITTRSAGMPPQFDPGENDESSSHALRRVLEEYDRSHPPVQPAIPFDTPRIPSLSFRRDFEKLDLRKQKKECMRKLHDDEINNALMQSYNRDSVRSTLFLEAFMAFERRSAHGKSMEEIADLRYGQWIFMYAVLQSLPLVVVDAPGIQWSKGVEYFLCEVPKGSPPWVQSDSHSVQKAWYGVSGSSNLISLLPADVVEHGVDGIYHRSHCWRVAEKWAGDPISTSTALPYNDLSPPSMPGAQDSRAQSPNSDRRASLALGLEALPVPQGVIPSGSRPVSVHDPNKTFGSILGQEEGLGKGKKK